MSQQRTAVEAINQMFPGDRLETLKAACQSEWDFYASGAKAQINGAYNIHTAADLNRVIGLVEMLRSSN